MSKNGDEQTPEMRAAHRNYIGSRDCESAAKYLRARNELVETDSEAGNSVHADHIEGLLLAAIVSYARPFTISRTGGNATPKVDADLGEVFQACERKLNLHQLILDRRDQAVAHADWKYHSTEIISASAEDGVLRKFSPVIFEEGIDMDLFIEIVDNMIEYLRREGYDLDIG